MKKQYTILCVTNNYTPYCGGVVSSLNALAQGLTQKGHRVIIVTLDFLAQSPASEHNIIRLYCPIRFRYCNNAMAIPWRPYQQLKKIILNIQPDIIHAHHPFLLGIAAQKIAHTFSIPFLFTYHTQYEEYAHYLGLPQQITKPLIQAKVKKFCNNTSAIIAPSKSIKMILEERLIRTPLHVVPSPVDPLFFQHQPIIKKKIQQFHLITVSRFAPEKNITFLLDTFAQLDHQRFFFTLIGYGPQKEYLRSYALQQLGLNTKTLQFIEKPPKSIIKTYYEQADLFLFASTTETQGLVLAEAMACHKPVIALDAPGARDIVIPGINGFLVNTKKQMADYIEQIATDQHLLEFLQQNAACTAQEYRMEKICAKLETLFSSLHSSY